MIEVRNLTKTFGPVVAVDNISFTIRKSEIVGFLGPNGAGKTTTMRILTCFLAPDKGTAKVGGYDVIEDPIKVKEKIGYLPENSPLYYDMEVIDFLKFIVKMRNIPSDKASKRLKEVIDICGLGNHLHRPIGQLSRGFKQRVGLAQALVHDPEILILDEPTSGLDPNQIVEIRQLIKELGREKTLIISTHILPEVQATSKRVLIINKGKIVADGSPDELVEKSRRGETFYVTIKGPSEEILDTLKNMESVSYCKALNRKNNSTRFLVKGKKEGEEFAEEIFKMVVQKRWILTELRKETVSLEEIFRELTKGGL